MVGVPRSSGCRLCRKRKVKCDEARPQCGNCIKYGAVCPGYDRAIKFVAGKHQIRQRGKRANNARREESISSDDTLPGATVVAFRPSQIVVTPVPRLTPPQSPPIDRLLRPMRGHVIYQMMENLWSTAPPDMLRLFQWIEAGTLGSEALLDGAICSLSLHLSGKETCNAQLIAQSRTVYGKSLTELQAALRHPSRWRCSETLFAAILLCYFELFAGTSSPDTWLQHAKGIGVLMERRGPLAHADGWNAAILLSFRGILIMSDMFFPGEEDCFLSRPEWKAVMCDGGRCLIHPVGTPISTIAVVDGFFQLLVDVPGILRWGYMVREANRACMPVDPARLTMLAHLAAANHASFSRWYDNDFASLPYVSATEALPADPDTALYPTILEYEYPWAGSMLLGYWASMLILQETLTQCGAPVADSETAQRDLVSKILRSVESIGRGIMGPYRVGYSLRIAYEFADVEARIWIGGLLDQFSKRYAATDKATYPTLKE